MEIAPNCKWSFIKWVSMGSCGHWIWLNKPKGSQNACFEEDIMDETQIYFVSDVKAYAPVI